MTTGYICRHGQTEGNLNSISQGWKDSPLTDIGKEHAKSLSFKLSKLNIKKIISSDIGRAVETAKIINSYIMKDILLSSGIREMTYGIYDGKSDNILIRENAGYNSLSYQFPDGESPKMFIKRISKFFDSFEEEYSNDPFLIVTHQGVIKAIMILAGKIKEDEFYTKKIPHELIGIINIENKNIISFEFL